MPNSDLLASLLFKINQNQIALEAAIMELRSGSSNAVLLKSPVMFAWP
jgi:hypothetical protein